MQLGNYAKHPLRQITQNQSSMTFIDEIRVKDQQSNSAFEAKLIKYILRGSECKMMKAFKAYNY
jgi:hypothetical protein